MDSPDPSPAAGLLAAYDAHRAALRRFLAARSGDATEAEDLMQELWLAVHAGTSGPVSNPRAYLFRMANNLVLARRRAALRGAARDRAWITLRHGAVTEPEDDTPAADAAMIAREEAAALASAIANLPPAAGRAFRLHKFEGLSHEQVAQQLGISRSGVEKHIAVAMTHLRRALADDDGGLR
ncbi:RNA polymerase sigma factor [Sphingomonas sp. AR_OL41]|uniref:RNA polymerase sigma factor n=1 Tax=Sphingomonas sp. AR_OL41 TaxID=3042729 RepID=UPI0024810109|nr:RNA polymerase sigma factor [Sphingomonas sp. AR_OL41]MDH7975630.1 RNA polymerase sigma factor [Sphingomonas sp. AR_OL41]